MTLNYTLAHPDTVPPTRGTTHSAGLDLTVDEDVVLPAGGTRIVSTGVSVDIPTGMVGKVYIRSSFGANMGIVLANQVGIIDADYRGEVMLALRNMGDKRMTIQRGTRTAQLVVQRVEMLVPERVDALPGTGRGAGGFGSTGTGALA